MSCLLVSLVFYLAFVCSSVSLCFVLFMYVFRSSLMLFKESALLSVFALLTNNYEFGLVKTTLMFALLIQIFVVYGGMLIFGGLNVWRPSMFLSEVIVSSVSSFKFSDKNNCVRRRFLFEVSLVCCFEALLETGDIPIESIAMFSIAPRSRFGSSSATASGVDCDGGC